MFDKLKLSRSCCCSGYFQNVMICKDHTVTGCPENIHFSHLDLIPWHNPIQYFPLWMVKLQNQDSMFTQINLIRQLHKSEAQKIFVPKIWVMCQVTCPSTSTQFSLPCAMHASKELWSKENTNHPVSALNSLVRFTGMEKWLITTQCEGVDNDPDCLTVSFFHQLKFSAWLLLGSSMSWLWSVQRSKQSSYIETTASMFWYNHCFNATF